MRILGSKFAISRACMLAAFVVPASISGFAGAQAADPSAEVTFHKDIEPILQRSCQSCHNPEGVAPMSLVSYEEVAPYAGLIEYKTGLRDRAGAMPPWYVEKDIGIQDFKNDPSLSDAELAAISRWARSGVPKGDPSDAPQPLQLPLRHVRHLEGQPQRQRDQRRTTRAAPGRDAPPECAMGHPFRR